MSDEPKVFYVSDVEVAWNGDHQDPWIDLDLHSDDVKPDESTIVGRVSLRPGEALRLAEQILVQYRRLHPTKEEDHD